MSYKHRKQAIKAMRDRQRKIRKSVRMADTLLGSSLTDLDDQERYGFTQEGQIAKRFHKLYTLKLNQSLWPGPFTVYTPAKHMMSGLIIIDDPYCER